MDGLLLILFGIAACIVAVVGPIILVKKTRRQRIGRIRCNDKDGKKSGRSGGT